MRLHSIRGISFIAIFSVALSILTLSVPREAPACIGPPPPTLLERYLMSDLVVLGEITSEKFLEEPDPEASYPQKIIKNVRILKAYKGTPKGRISFVRTETRPAETDGAGAAPVSQRVFRGMDLPRSSIMLPGNQYVLFLGKRLERETRTPYLYEAWEVTPEAPDVICDRLDELKAILDDKENTYEKLAEWMVRLIEEPETRDNGISDLSESFSPPWAGIDGLNFRVKITDLPAGSPFDENGNSPEIAGHLTDSHKARISAVLDRLMRDDRSIDPFDIYRLITLVSNWDKVQLSSQFYAALKNTDKGDFGRINSLMTYLNLAVYDTRLRQIQSDYSNAAEGARPDTPESSGPTAPEEVATVEDNNAEPKEETKNDSFIADPAADSGKTDKGADLRADERREKLLSAFLTRFEYLLAGNFTETCTFFSCGDDDAPAEQKLTARGNEGPHNPL